MSALVGTHRDGNVAVIIVDNPPVNALKHEVRLGIQDAFLQANADQTVSAIVLTCAGRTFIAGADISEFNKPPQSPSLIELIAVIDSTDKPVVAAMFGTALGGGLEVTLACHFRIAAAGTRLGFPEIKLGIIPGAGGTQRLPRLVGMPKAMAMILSGDPIPAKEALAVGLIDEIFEGDPRAAGVAFARRVVAEKRPLIAPSPANSMKWRRPMPSARAGCTRRRPRLKRCAGRSIFRSRKGLPASVRASSRCATANNRRRSAIFFSRSARRPRCPT
jgi:3-hydroxyacyl-CoA dehydrogenase